MLISVRCPSCLTQYQLKPELRGQTTRCPNSVCREAFVVQEDGDHDQDTSVEPSPRHEVIVRQQQSSGHVGDLVPLVSAEAADEPPEAPPPPSGGPQAKLMDVESWQTAPPPVRKETPPPPPPQAPAPPPPPAVADWKAAPPPVRKEAPAPPPAADWQAAPPPVRQKSAPTAEPPQPTPEPPPPIEAPAFDWSAARLPASAPKPAPPPAGKSHAGRWIMVGLLLVIAGGIFAVVQFVGTVPQSADDIWQAAKAAQDQGYWRDAATQYDVFAKNFPDSSQAKEAEFLADYCRVKDQVHPIGVPPEAGLETLQLFLERQQANPILATYQADIRNDFIKLAQKFVQWAERRQPVEEHLEAVERDLTLATRMLAEAKQRSPSDPIPTDIRQAYDNLADAVVQAHRLHEFIAELRGMKPDPKALQDKLAVASAELLKHPKVMVELDRLRSESLQYVRYQVLNLPPKPGGPPQESAPALLIAPRLDDGKAANPTGTVFALARGVLYALADTDGRVQWAVRVGIDTTQLPIRLRPTETDPEEIVLVLSSDSNTLCARNVRDGVPRWHIELGQTCLGRPLVVRDADVHRIYLALYDGRILEIEPATGIVLGEYQLGLPLTVGGVRQPGTSLLYFPADRGQVYVIDFKKRQCVAILASDHPSGSLRGEPIVVADPQRTDLPRYLILSQADGFAAMKLRAFALPIEKNSVVLKEEALRGWSWFPPWCDGEKIVLATDAGVLGLVGIKQYGNQDPPLFPLLAQPVGNEDAIGYPQLVGPAEPGRAVIVHARENDFWVLGRGGLQHWRIGIAPTGLTAGPVWREPLQLGTPLHAGQVSGDHLVVATRAANGDCRATAVDAATGQIRWQRQLGLVARGTPLDLNGQAWVEDQGGGLFLFTADRKPPWQRLAGAKGTADLLLPDGDAVLTFQAVDGQTLLRRFTADPKAAPQETRFRGRLAGTPAVAGNDLVAPLADGHLLRLPLHGNGPGQFGRTWRADYADVGSPGHVVRIRGNDFAVTDGSRGLCRLSWPQPMKWEAGRVFTLPDRIVAAPLAVPVENGEPNLCIADAAGTLRLLRLQTATIEELRAWTPGGVITAGPFLVAGKIGCVLDGRRIVLLDPDRAEPLWFHEVSPAATTQIVGTPRQIGPVILVADSAGRLVGLDPATGKPQGKEYSLRGSAAFASAPVPFGADQLFVPLTDGTILLVSRGEFTK